MIVIAPAWKRNRPQFVTFTGVDDQTSILGLQVLSEEFPVEWGVLFSPRRQGAGRYPPLHFVRDLIDRRGTLHLAAHLCGDYAEEFIETGACESLRDVLPAFRRIQVNTQRSEMPLEVLGRRASQGGYSVILQCRGSFPPAREVTWLFDASGGRGLRPAAWPAGPAGGQLVGYAGGLGPECIIEAVSQIAPSAEDYYLDMESGIRDASDLFSIERCRDVLRRIYGAGGKFAGATPAIGLALFASR